MSHALDHWLTQATRCLSKDSIAQVRAEIQEHYESAREAAFNAGATPDEADRLAVTAFGDPKSANRQYRRVLLTVAESRLLQQGSREMQAVCAGQSMKRVLFSVIAVSLIVAVVTLSRGATGLSRDLSISALAMTSLFVFPLLPIYTPARSRIARYAKWSLLVLIFLIVFGRNVREYSWLLVSTLAYPVWIEWKRNSIRRKLPVAEWPKHLYL